MQHATNIEAVAIANPSALVERKEIAAIMGKMVKALDRRNNIPIMHAVRMDSTFGGLRITGTDLDMELQATLAAPVDPGLSCAVPAQKLKDVLTKAKASDLVGILPLPLPDNEKESPETVFDFAGMNVTMQGERVQDFPILTAFGDSAPVEFALDGATFARLLREVSFAMSSEETRYYLNGAYLHLGELDGDLRIVATDGHRLGIRSFGQVSGTDGMPGVIIPRKALMLLLDIFGRTGKDTPETVWLSVSEDHTRFTFDHWQLTTKQVDGTFPDYGRVIPSLEPWNHQMRATMNRADMLDAVKSLNAIANERGRAVALNFTPDSVHMAVNNPDMGKADMTLDAETSADLGELLIAYNAAYLGDILTALDCDQVTFMMTDCGAPSRITDADKVDSTDCYVLMPVRI